MLLSYLQLKELAVFGVIENVTDDLINGASIDITLAPTILLEHPGFHKVSLKDKQPLSMYKFNMTENGYHLKPGAFILASSQQIFNMPLNLSAEYKLKSSMARISLNHLNAGWIDPGWHGSALTLELVNCSSNTTIIIRPGDRIGQVVFFQHDEVPEEFSYIKRGRYNGDRQVSGVKPERQLDLFEHNIIK